VDMRYNKRKRKKSKLARVLEYWTRQSGRIIKLLLGVIIIVIVIIALLWLIPILIDVILGLW